MNMVATAAWVDVLQNGLGVVVGLAGLTTAVLCAFAVADGSVRRGVLGGLVGLGLLAAGLVLLGTLP